MVLSGCFILLSALCVIAEWQNMLCQPVICIIGYDWTFRKQNLIYVVIVAFLFVERKEVGIHFDLVSLYVKECTFGAV